MNRSNFPRVSTMRLGQRGASLWSAGAATQQAGTACVSRVVRDVSNSGRQTAGRIGVPRSTAAATVSRACRSVASAGLARPAGCPTPVSVEFQPVVPSNERELVIGDHVACWNYLAYDAISVRTPTPWRLESALLVGKDRAAGTCPKVVARRRTLTKWSGQGRRKACIAS